MAAASDLDALMREIFAAAVAAADPAAFTRTALDAAFPRGDEALDRIWIIAAGMAAHAMAGAATTWAAARTATIVGGIVVGTHDGPSLHPRIEVLAGDHPIPGARSAAAAERVAALCDDVGANDIVLVLMSGGASALIGAPVDTISVAEFGALNELLLGSGLDVARMNLVRKRFSRWGAGRLAAALVPAIVQPVLLSDVPGDDPSAIGSGPCAPDASTAVEIETLLRGAGIASRVPLSVAAHIGAVRAGELPETPKPDSIVFRRVRMPAVGGNHSALDGAARAATARGIPRVIVEHTPLSGDAASAGRAIARAALASAPGTCRIVGGETTVALAARHGTGGRNQQLALAAAQVLSQAGSGGDAAPCVMLLAAGTDGRDGPTDAAGAIVTNDTWNRIRAAGLDPARELDAFNAYAALDAARALVRTGPTGTNVADIVIALSVAPA